MTRKGSGFTLVEVIISLAIFAIIAAVLFTILIRNQQSARVTSNLVEAQQNARVAVDVLSRDIRMAGYGVDVLNYQPVVQYAAPFEIMYNANLTPFPDTSDPRGDPLALDWTGSNLPPHSQRPSTDPHDTTGAETVVYTLDYNEDGNIDNVDVGEAEGNEQARVSYNPNDMMLMRRVYGYNSSLGENTVTSEELALVRGPIPAGSVIEPLFLYWLDTDRDGIADSLYGDTEAPEGELNENEIAALTPLEWPDDAATLRQIRRVTVTAIGEMPERDRSYDENNGYRQVRVTSDVTIPEDFVIEKREIAGTVYRDCGGVQTGLQGWRVELSPAIYDISASDGSYSFEVAPGAYQVELKDVVDPWYFTMGGAIQIVDVTDDDVTDANYYIDSPYGTVYGYVFYDVDRNGSYDPEPAGNDSTIKYTPGDTAALGWGIRMYGHTAGGRAYTDPSNVAPPESEYTFVEFAWRDSFYWWDVETFTNPDSPNPYIYVRENDSFQTPDECDFNFQQNIPLIKASIMPSCSLDTMTTGFVGGRLVNIFWFWKDSDTDWDSVMTSLYVSLDAELTWQRLRYTVGPDTAIEDTLSGDSMAVNKFQWIVPFLDMDSLTYDLRFKTVVDDPDTLNDSCESVSEPLRITRPWLGFTGQYLFRDRVPGTRDFDVHPMRHDTIHVEGLQVIPRVNEASDHLHLPDTTIFHSDTLEEDTAMVITDSAGLYDLVIYWQQDTVDTEGLTGDTTLVYSDSARWISRWDDPVGSFVPEGLWRFYLWGNYESEVDCQVKFVAELYCSDNEGNTDDSLRVFSTDTLGTVSMLLPRSPGRELIEIRHAESFVGNCRRLMVRLKVRRIDDEEEEAKVYFYYNSGMASYMLTPRIEE